MFGNTEFGGVLNAAEVLPCPDVAGFGGTCKADLVEVKADAGDGWRELRRS